MRAREGPRMARFLVASVCSGRCCQTMGHCCQCTVTIHQPVCCGHTARAGAMHWTATQARCDRWPDPAARSSRSQTWQGSVAAAVPAAVGRAHTSSATPDASSYRCRICKGRQHQSPLLARMHAQTGRRAHLLAEAPDLCAILRLLKLVKQHGQALAVQDVTVGSAARRQDGRQAR